jgi:HSP20 family protein
MFARRLFDIPSVGWQHPFAEMERMSRQVDRLTQALLGSPGLHWRPAAVFPAVNLTENKDRYYVRAELPGIKSDAIDVQVNGRNLTIAGERTIPSEGERIKYHRKEREAGKFSRVISLPGGIEGDRVDAKMRNGVLTVTIPKSEASKPKQIKVS